MRSLNAVEYETVVFHKPAWTPLQVVIRGWIKPSILQFSNIVLKKKYWATRVRSDLNIDILAVTELIRLGTRNGDDEAGAVKVEVADP